MNPDSEHNDEEAVEATEERDFDAEQDELDHSAAAVLERESAKKERAEYVHPEGARDFRVEGNDVRDYVGVDQEYRTYANPTEAPMLTDTERYDLTTQYDHLEGNFDEASDEESDYEKQARYEQLLSEGVSEHDAREEVWPEPAKTEDSEPGTAGETPGPDPDPKLGKESKADPEVSPSGFTPFA